jgi:hypothetical protein
MTIRRFTLFGFATLVLSMAAAVLAAPVPEGTRTAAAMSPQVVGLDSVSASFLFPSAGSVQGNGGTYFRSDVTIANYRSSPQKIAIYWLAGGQNNSAAQPQYLTLNANTTYSFRDFVGATLGKSGLGAVLVNAVNSSNQFDSQASIDGFSRIWTNQPGASGTVSLSFPSVAQADSYSSGSAVALGLRQDSGFRTNAGIVNLDSATHTWSVHVGGINGSTDFTIQVPPFSQVQTSIPAGNWSDLYLSFTPDASNFYWSAFGATADNITGDGWVAHAEQLGGQSQGPSNANIGGTWDVLVTVVSSNVYPAGNSYTAVLTASQSGANVSGTFLLSSGFGGQVNGTVSGQNFSFSGTQPAPCTGYFTGYGNVSGNQMNGAYTFWDYCGDLITETFTATKR